MNQETKEEMEFRVEAKAIASEVQKQNRGRAILLAVVIACVIVASAS